MAARFFIYRAMPTSTSLSVPRALDEAIREGKRDRFEAEARAAGLDPSRVQIDSVELAPGAVKNSYFLYSPERWFTRDLIMSAIKLAVFLALAVVTARAGGAARWGWTWAASSWGVVALAIVTAMIILSDLSGGSQPGFSPGRIAVGWLATGTVALFEETAFRSLLFLPFRERMHPIWAALLSSLLFMFYHVQAQPLIAWPHILVFGLGACAALHRGCGLPWLVAAHWIADGVWYHIASGPPVAWASDAYRVSMLVGAGLSLALLARRQPALPAE
jgi:membrane protease YdiL (CAAX protease family)